MSMSEYTGPTGIKLIEGRLHIEGYPTARKLVKVPETLGKRIADLRLHQSDLEFCEQAMQEFGRLRNIAPFVSRATWIAILVKYFSCFGANHASAPLAPG